MRLGLAAATLGAYLGGGAVLLAQGAACKGSILAYPAGNNEATNPARRSGSHTAAAPPASCDAVPGLDPLLRSHGVLLLGEMHGTVESPAFASRVVCLALAARHSVTIGLEIPLEEQSRIGAFLASSGLPGDRDALLGGAFSQAPFQDGRRSQAMLALLDDLRRLHRAGRPVRLVLLDSSAGAGGPERDRAMAVRLRSAVAAGPHDLFVVLTGNIHTRIRRGTPWNPAYEPMGFLVTQLAPKLVVTALDVAYSGGTAWICETPQPASCGPKTLKGRPDAGGSRVTVFATVGSDGYSGTYGVGTLSASPPAVPQAPLGTGDTAGTATPPFNAP